MLIRVLSHGGQPPATPSAARFDAAGGHIGRGLDCTLVLPDPQRLMSRHHALVGWRDGGFFIRQLGANLTVEVQGQPLGPEADAPLAPGMRIRIGPYLLETEAEPAEIAPPAPVPAPAIPTPSSAATRPSAFSAVLATAPPPPSEAGAPPPAAPPLPPGAPAPADAAALVAALYAGLELPVPAAPTPQELQLIGALLHAALGGLLELLATRHMTKRELGAPGTRLQPRENNPLKFSPDVDTALVHLLAPPRRGFIPPLAAVREAFDDVRTHEISLLAGLRAALDTTLARLTPEELEKRLPKGGWSPPLDVWRRAQLWERYCEQHAQLLAELREQADPLSGRAFLEAYEAQRDKLARGPGAQ
ncbi:type VI secretion system-associated FHA domain protein TagH [Azohydromonas caseinilytica]|uniref:Type VI secretion system-associated FHA domain protein TagH n=1 Tax=Azohydromonas caseinilytica TaxID=2728836 RepID=A0A848F0P6_9BURK|nr:type VI secretion system-associated FHA domain protein TagH [Azohydromonas caseinilytica]NML13627.1 type VI secretion system-associated FHA domain protein TagH [Azohydromonas caseinilytica]